MKKILPFGLFPTALLAASACIAPVAALGAPATQSALDQDPDGQLSIVAEDGDVANANGEIDLRIAELENELARAREEADRVRLEQEELRARLGDLDEQILLARQIIELQETRLARFQASLAAEAEEQARLEAERLAEAEAAAAAEAVAGASFPRTLLGNPVYLAIAAAILALAFVLMSRGGRRKDEEPEEPVMVGEEEEIAEKINLAYSFHKMGETVKARGILEEVVRTGNAEQVGEAKQLLASIDESG